MEHDDDFDRMRSEIAALDGHVQKLDRSIAVLIIIILCFFLLILVDFCYEMRRKRRPAETDYVV